MGEWKTLGDSECPHPIHPILQIGHSKVASENIFNYLSFDQNTEAKCQGKTIEKERQYVGLSLDFSVALQL